MTTTTPTERTDDVTTTETPTRLQRRADHSRAQADAARETLARVATVYTPDALARAVLDVLEAEGEAHVAATAARVERYVAEHPDAGNRDVREAVTDLLLAGADDTWSGRGNDAKRAYHDGVLRGARRVLHHLDDVE